MKLATVANIMRDPRTSLPAFCEEAARKLDGAKPDLATVFCSSHFEDDGAAIAETVQRCLPSAVVVGCSAESVIGPDAEYEQAPAISMMVASLPGVTVKPLRVPGDALTGLGDAEGLRDVLRLGPLEKPAFLMFGDPFTVPINIVLDHFNDAWPGRPVYGGMVSGCEQPGQAVLVCNGEIQRDGAVILALAGEVDLNPVVSQGCRPIGEHFVITRGEGYVIKELSGKPPVQRLREVLAALSPQDAQLVEQAIFVGRVINEYKETFSRGDFLIRNLLGLDPKTGSMAVGEQIRVGSTVQFHVRDSVSADEDLRAMLRPYKDPGSAAGVLLFSCNGRGTRMWSEPNHDVSAVRDMCGPIPVAGFFAAGEIGPIGGKNFVHGHTASMAMFRPAAHD